MVWCDTVRKLASILTYSTINPGNERHVPLPPRLENAKCYLRILQSISTKRIQANVILVG